MRNKRLNIPLPPLRPREERHLSPFYRPVQHANLFSDPDQDYDKLRSEVRENRGENPDDGAWRLLIASARRRVKRYRLLENLDKLVLA